MNNPDYKSEIRDSEIRDLLDKARKRSYEKYLASIQLERIRLFRGVKISFDFPVTALIGPNGSGKSTILGAAACAYTSPSSVFTKSRLGDDSMDDWELIYEVIDRTENPRGTIQSTLRFKNNSWLRDTNLDRSTKVFSINRTVPAAENAFFLLKKRLRVKDGVLEKTLLSVRQANDIESIKRQAEKILGKSLAAFTLFEILSFKKSGLSTGKLSLVTDATSYVIDQSGNLIPDRRIEPEILSRNQQSIFVGSDGTNQYSEFSFGSGESSVIRIVADIESLPNHSLVLIEELENGLHPIAVQRLVEYLIDAAGRKNIQAIFTTHSDYALDPLPPEAIWAAVNGTLQQGKLSVGILRAVSGRVDKKLAIYVEDEFAKAWIEMVVRHSLNERADEIGIYPVAGDGNAVKVHLGHMHNPSIKFHSLCFIDGDSQQKEDPDGGIYRLPGLIPESTVFDSVVNDLNRNIALLTVACQCLPNKQQFVAEEITQISRTNRDPHLLFNQVGLRIGFVAESIVRGAFLVVWVQENPDDVRLIAEPIKKSLELPPKS